LNRPEIAPESRFGPAPVLGIPFGAARGRAEGGTAQKKSSAAPPTALFYRVSDNEAGLSNQPLFSWENALESYLTFANKYVYWGHKSLNNTYFSDTGLKRLASFYLGLESKTKGVRIYGHRN